MNDLIKQFVEQAGGDFWQRIESDGVLNKEAYITFDPPENLAKFVELIVGECLSYAKDGDLDFMKFMIKKHFGVE
jgi:hypothetical protein